MGKRNVLILISFVILTCSCATYNGGYHDFFEHCDVEYGFETVEGKTIVEPQFIYADDFSDGFAFVCKKDDTTCGFIDKTGKYVLNGLRYNQTGSFQEGLTWLKRGEKFGYIDTTLRFVIPPQFDNVKGFTEGLATVQVGNKWGYIDKTGKFVIPPQFDGANGFSEGLAAVSRDGKWGYIDTTNKVVIEPQFSDVLAHYGGKQRGGFRNGLAPVEITYLKQYTKTFAATTVEWGLIDKTGSFILEPQFYNIITHHVSDMKTGIYLDRSEARIDAKGKILRRLYEGNIFDLGLGPTEGTFKTRKQVNCRYIEY